jgi:hypothetical protein
MKYSISLIITLVILTACSQPGSRKFFSADNSKIVLVGRFDISNRSAPVFMYSGCVIRTVFSGTSVEAVIKDDSLRNMFNVFVDGNLSVLRTDKPEGRYLLADSLKDGRHTLEINRRTEWHGGNTTFAGLYLDRGRKLYKPAGKSRLVEFIGDSYTCGYGDEGRSREDHFTYETENNYLTYGSLTARALDAEYMTVCRSGIGMWQGYGGDTSFTMPKLYNQVIINGKNLWDFRKVQPDAVVIDLGGNDFSVKLDSASYVNTYLDFLTTVRHNYPDAVIVCVAGPDVPGKTFDTWKSYVHTIVDHFSRNDSKIASFEFSPFEPNGSDWHPNVGEHRKMSEELIPFLKNRMKW